MGVGHIGSLEACPASLHHAAPHQVEAPRGVGVGGEHDLPPGPAGCRRVDIVKIEPPQGDEVRDWVEGLGFTVQGIVESPITGPEGNVEFLISASRD